jgi:hypothetical protein
MTRMPPDETDAEAKASPVVGCPPRQSYAVASFCVVLVMVAGLAWLAIHYLERASF